MRNETLPLITIILLFVSGCINLDDTFDISSSKIGDLNLGDEYILTCHVPKDTSVNYYKFFESEKKGYSVRGVYLTNELGRTDFFIYELTSGRNSLDYLFNGSKEAYKSQALDDWNKKHLISKGYDRDFYTYQSSTMKEMNGVKIDRVIRTTAKDQKGNMMIAEACWFDYANAFWFMTSTWSKDYFDAWWSSDIILHYPD